MVFTAKDKVKFVAEGISNTGVALLVGGMIGFATTDHTLESIVTALSGLAIFVGSAKLLEGKPQ
jgi:hypothetical protein